MTIQDTLRELNVDFLESGNHHCREGWLQIRECPYCNSESYHLGFNLSARFFSCWKCGGHRAVETWQKLGLDRKQARTLLSEFDVDAPDTTKEKIRGKLKEPSGRGELSIAHRRYLLERNFDPNRIALVWKIEGIGIASCLAWRIYIPIIYKNRRVSWTTRAIGDRVEQRYISASAEEEAMNHKHLIYGLDYCTHSVVIVEGPTDAWAIGPGAGATFGTAFLTEQVRHLVSIPHRIVCFDSSRDAQNRATELCGQLSAFPGVTENIQLDAKDPGSASAKELRLLRHVARL